MRPFDGFVLFAEMRTGSNFLEANLNGFADLHCHGEAFNPHFIGYPDRTEICGVTLAEREADPRRLLTAIRAQPGQLGGFRFFNDHDPRALNIILPDPRVAKVILTRNPIESYVSRKIAAATGQWKLTNAKHARTEAVRFDAAEFEGHLEAVQAFQVRLLKALQTTGQTGFYVDYEDLQDVAVMNGLARWLGSAHQIEALDKKLKKQNPEALDDKVINFDQMERALARLDRFNLSRTPNFEPRRGAAIPTHVTAAKSPLIFLPLRSGPEAEVRAWMAALDGGAAPQDGHNHKTLRQWKEQHPRHRSFAVLRHPLARAHTAFCERILARGPGSFPELRDNLRRTYALAVPEGGAPDDWDDVAHGAAFAVFLGFLKANLAGQTSLRIDPAWASQLALLQGIATLAPPDMILREDRLADDLACLARQIGRADAPRLVPEADPHAPRLTAIHTPALEVAAREAYGRDYLTFGFGDWRG